MPIQFTGKLSDRSNGPFKELYLSKMHNLETRFVNSKSSTSNFETGFA